MKQDKFDTFLMKLTSWVVIACVVLAVLIFAAQWAMMPLG